jgi:murein L,D-transpeptidase YcbB/YkuD
VSAALVRLVSDLHLGRVDPRELGFDYERGPKRAEIERLIDELAGNAPVGTVVDAAGPPFLQTPLLERALARYRDLAADPGTAPVVLTATVRPGRPCDAAPRLARWLAALGDLPVDAATSATLYDDALVEAVQRFQLRHGLTPDGIIGPATAAALAVPAAARTRQIELALERLRWLPVLGRDRTVVVNVPGFELRAFDAVEAGRPAALQMSVVVGQAIRTQTPFFASAMTQVIFAPYWNVPPGILRKELLPKIRARPGWLAEEEMEIVSAGHVLAPTADAIARLAQGTAELRQRPGDKNALGHVKFVFPNRYNVYMHDTPARGLFRRARRDFSHGCIRLADAPALAHWVLGEEGMDGARVDEMLALERETIVRLRRPITVVVAYATAVAHRDGTISFYDDVYGHDAELDAALR